RQVVSFEVDARELQPGPQQLKVELGSSDALPFNNRRFATFIVREARSVLVLADDPSRAEPWKAALDAVGEFRADVRRPDGIAKEGPAALAKCHMVCLFSLARPDAKLWPVLAEYVQNGRGLAVLPPGDELSLQAYNSDAAQALLPGRFVAVNTAV